MTSSKLFRLGFCAVGFYSFAVFGWKERGGDLWLTDLIGLLLFGLVGFLTWDGD